MPRDERDVDAWLYQKEQDDQQRAWENRSNQQWDNSNNYYPSTNYNTGASGSSSGGASWMGWLVLIFILAMMFG